MLNNFRVIIARNFPQACTDNKHKEHSSLIDCAFPPKTVLTSYARKLYYFFGTCRENEVIEQKATFSLLSMTEDEYDEACLELEEAGYLCFSHGELHFFADGQKPYVMQTREWLRLNTLSKIRGILDAKLEGEALRKFLEKWKEELV